MAPCQQVIILSGQTGGTIEVWKCIKQHWKQNTDAPWKVPVISDTKTELASQKVE